MLEGPLLYRVLAPPSERALDPTGAPVLVGPCAPHEVVPLRPVRFQVELHRTAKVAEEDRGGGKE